MPEHELLLHDQVGVRLRELRHTSFSLARRVGTVGGTTINLPHKAGYAYSDFARDQIVTVSASLPGGGSYLEGETLWFVRGREYNQNGLSIYLEDANTILKRRIVAYAAASAQASKAGNAFDLIRAIIRENFGSLAPAGRDVSAFLAIQGDDGFGATVAKDFAWRKVLDVIRDIAAACEEAGTYCGFDIVASHAPLATVVGRLAFGLEFRVFKQQRGIDHRWPSGAQPIIIGSEFGSLANPKVVEMWTDEESFTYAGGQGQDSDRLIDSAANQELIDQAIFGRIEGFRSVSQAKTSAALIDEASAQLAAKAGRVKVTGDLQETPNLRYGIDVRYGDFVTVSEAGIRADARLNAIQISADRNGVQRKIALEGGY